MTSLRVRSSIILCKKPYANIIIGAFYMVGDFASARAKGEKILADLEKST